MLASYLLSSHVCPSIHNQQVLYLMGSPPMGAQNAGGVGKHCVLRPEKSPAQTPYRWKFVSIHHGGPRPRLCTGGGIQYFYIKTWHVPFTNKPAIIQNDYFWCFLLVNWTKKHCFDFGPLAPLCENMWSSTKTEVRYILHCHQMQTEPRPKKTCIENVVQFVNVNLRHAKTDRHTDRHADHNTSHP